MVEDTPYLLPYFFSSSPPEAEESKPYLFIALFLPVSALWLYLLPVLLLLTSVLPAWVEGESYLLKLLL